MKSSNLSFKPVLENPFNLGKTSEKSQLSEVFTRRQESYLNEFKLFMVYFNAIPNFIHETRIDCRKANIWFAENYKSQIKEHYFSKRQIDFDIELDDIFYFIDEDLLIQFDVTQSIVRFLFKRTEMERVEEIITQVRKFKKRKIRRVSKITLLVQTAQGIETKAMKITKPKLRIEDNYNEDFKPIHQTILKRLLKKNEKGLVLLHGKPGTGKTSYIRYLAASVKKEVIFLPPNMASAITNPNLISILIDNPNSIFVIEDAENIVVDRNTDGSSPVSALLNISDGLLADCLNVQIICSFNTDISKIDSALLRKGRLIAKYEFKELETEKARQLSEKLGYNTSIHSPMTLTSIYNQDEMDFQVSKNGNTIGFRSITENTLVKN